MWIRQRPSRIVVISSLDLGLAELDDLGGDAFCAKDVALADPVTISAVFALPA